MRVLHVIAHFDRGGSELQLAGLIRAAHGVHWDATLCVLNPGYPLAHELHEQGIPLVELEQRRRRDLGRVARLRSTIRAGGFDVVHSTLWRGSLVARAAASFRGRPAVVMAERAAEWFRPARERAVDHVLRRVTDRYVGNSEAVKEFICWAHGVGPDRVAVIGNAVDDTVFHPGPTSPRTVARIGSVGRLATQKGYDVLLAALPAVLARRPVEVEIVGAGEQEGALRRQAGALPVRFAGRIDDQGEVAAFLRGLDVFVLPTRFEGLPNSILEARACGVPVVATAAPGVAEAMPSGSHLVPIDDVPALAEAILAALDGASSSETLRPPSFDDVARSHLEVFQAAVHQRRAR
jgi:glycosyltransferase involved in cell wall biosynthesis